MGLTMHNLTTTQSGRSYYYADVSDAHSASCSFLIEHPLSSQAPCELDILRHNCNTLCMNGAKVCVFEESDKESLSCLLQGQDSLRLKFAIGLELPGDLSHQSLERKLAQKQFGALLILADLAQRHNAR